MNENQPTIALSIRQPWAWLILHGGKDIENRTWKTNCRGRILIHASQTMTGEDYGSALYTADQVDIWREQRGASEELIRLPHGSELERGGIVGEVEIVDCVSESDSPWFFGPIGFVLRNPKPLPFRPCKGQLGFFMPSSNPRA